MKTRKLLAGGLTALLLSSGLRAGEEVDAPTLRVQLAHEGPVFAGEAVRVTIRFHNGMGMPFTYLARKDGPPSVIFDVLRKRDGAMVARDSTGGGEWVSFKPPSLGQLAPGESRTWPATILIRPDLVEGEEYRVAARHERTGGGEIGLWVGKIASPSIELVPSTEPVLFKWHCRYRREKGGHIVLNETVYTLRAGWLSVRRGSGYLFGEHIARESPFDGSMVSLPRKTDHADTGGRYREYPKNPWRGYPKKVLEVGKVQLVLAVQGAAGEAHFLFQEEDGGRKHVRVGPHGKVLTEEAVDAETTLWKKPDGEVVLCKAAGR